MVADLLLPIQLCPRSKEWKAKTSAVISTILNKHDRIYAMMFL
jgi:hypothetical protein